MSTDSSPGAKRGTSVHLLHMSGRGRTKGPRERRGGISLPVHLWQFIDTLAGLRTDAFKKMGGETKQSPSDELELAVEGYAIDVVEQYGPLPLTAADRKTYVDRMAEKMSEDLRRELSKAS